MIPTDLYKSILQRFTGDTSVKEKDFYTNDKFALWIDLRTHSDNNIHGSGLALRDTPDGVKLEIRRTTGGSGTITCHMFIVADALMEIRNSSLRSIMYWVTTEPLRIAYLKKNCYNTKKAWKN